MSNPEATTLWQGLAVQADLGNLFLNPGAAQQCSNACDDYLAKLRRSQKKAEGLTKIDAYGEFDSGRQLRDIYVDRAVGETGSMVSVLQSHIVVVEEMKVVFQKFFVATEDTDRENSSGIERAGPK